MLRVEILLGPAIKSVVCWPHISVDQEYNQKGGREGVNVLKFYLKPMKRNTK